MLDILSPSGEPLILVKSNTPRAKSQLRPPWPIPPTGPPAMRQSDIASATTVDISPTRAGIWRASRRGDSADAGRRCGERADAGDDGGEAPEIAYERDWSGDEETRTTIGRSVSTSAGLASCAQKPCRRPGLRGRPIARLPETAAPSTSEPGAALIGQDCPERGYPSGDTRIFNEDMRERHA